MDTALSQLLRNRKDSSPRKLCLSFGRPILSSNPGSDTRAHTLHFLSSCFGVPCSPSRTSASLDVTNLARMYKQIVQLKQRELVYPRS